MQIGDVLRKKRRERGETLEAVALRAGTDTGNLSRVEQNKQRPSLDLLESLATALETRVSVLYSEIETSSGRRRVGEGAAVDYGNDAVPLLRHWRALAPGNRRIVLEIIKAVGRTQREAQD